MTRRVSAESRSFGGLVLLAATARWLSQERALTQEPAIAEHRVVPVRASAFNPRDASWFPLDTAIRHPSNLAVDRRSALLAPYCCPSGVMWLLLPPSQGESIEWTYMFG